MTRYRAASPGRRSGRQRNPPTVMDDVMVHQLLHEADARLSVRCFFVVDEPVCELLRHEAVWVRSEVVTSVLNELPIVEAKPREKDGH